MPTRRPGGGRAGTWSTLVRVTDVSDRSGRKAAQPGRAPTLESVAARAGVSRGTASRVLTGSPKVSQHAHDAVMRAAAELRYTPNRAARSLVTRRSDSIAFVVAEPDDRIFSDPFFAAALRGGHAELAARGMQLVLAFASDEPERQRLRAFAAAGHVDGVALISLHGSDPLPRELRDVGVPMVLVGRPDPDDGGIPFIDADNRGGAREGTEVLTGLGRRRIATIAGPSDMGVGRDRLEGYRDALRGAGLEPDPALEAEADFSRPGGAEAMRRLLVWAPDVDAVFAANDLMAFGALAVLAAAGRRVPDDVAVVGFDDVPEATLSEPPLTTVRQPIEEMGVLMVRLLLDRPTDGRGGIVVPTQVVRRMSA